MKNIALFGGSFDPPHLGHLKIVEALKNLDFIDKTIVMPTFLNPFKSTFVADAKTRLHWLEKLFSDDENVEVNSFEVQKNEKVPTIVTVEHLKELYKDIYVVIGADNLASLPKWHRFDELQNLVKFIVVTRDGIEIQKEYMQLKVDVPVSSTVLRKKIVREFLPPKIAKEIEIYYKEHNAR